MTLVTTYEVWVVREPDEAVPKVHDLALHEVNAILFGLSFSVEAMLP